MILHASSYILIYHSNQIVIRLINVHYPHWVLVGYGQTPRRFEAAERS